MHAFSGGKISGRVSVVLVNYRGTDDTLACIDALRSMDFRAEDLEIICVDNASSDGRTSELRQVPGIVFVQAPRNLGFGAACNLAASHATGEFLALINNDARPDDRWLAEALAMLAAESSVACVASKVLDWEGAHIDFVDAAVTWFGMGYKPGAGNVPDASADLERDVLFATGAALVIRTDVFATVGGFDERYFLFYEDVDLGWRLNLAGYRVRYAPRSVVYHKHHASAAAIGPEREWFLLERNALMTLYKNLSDETLQRVLAPALALSVRRSIAVGGDPTSVLDAEVTTSSLPHDTTVTTRSLAGPYAIDAFVDLLPSLARSRAAVQRTRVRTDREIGPLLRRPLEPALPNERYLAGYAALVESFDLAGAFATTRRILVVTADPLTAKMAGPAIRAYHIAVALSAEHDVRLVSTSSATLSDPRFTIGSRTHSELRDDAAWADVVVLQGFVLVHAPWLATSDQTLVVDLYDPMLLEQLEQTRGHVDAERDHLLAATTGAINTQLLRGDFFLCASEGQRHFWLGQLSALGRVNPRTQSDDRSLRTLLGVVPFGVPEEPPTKTSSPVKGGAIPGIGADDKVILWAGGVYQWVDPLTALRAVAKLSREHSDLRLVFLGTQHPNSAVPQMSMLDQARALSDDLGLTDCVAFFVEGWVDYNDRQDYLLDADVGISTHFDVLESRFAYRARILDYIWAGLPVVATEGDTLADLVTTETLGVAVPSEDVDALAAALERCAYDAPFAAECAANARRVARSLAWDVALEPLVQFCRSPHRAADALVTERSRVALRARDAAAYLARTDAGRAARRSLGRVKRRLTSVFDTSRYDG